MLGKRLEQITLADLQGLVEMRVLESDTLEFKRENYRLNSPNADDKQRQWKELLKDTSAFANAHGGDLILGIEEETGAAHAIVGVQTNDADNLKRQIIAIVQNGVEPRISFSVHTIHVQDDRHVFIIRVRQSVHAPHRVVYHGEQGGFWARNSGGAHEMDANEIANLSRQSKPRQEQIEEFRNERVHAIHVGNTPVSLSRPHKIVIHLIPEQSFNDFQLRQDSLTNFAVKMPMLRRTRGWSHRHNLNGMVTYDHVQDLPPSGYVQLYRKGIIESVSGDVTFFHPNDVTNQHRLFKTDYLQEILAPMHEYLSLLQMIEAPLPIWFFMSFVGLNGVEILPRDLSGQFGGPIREEVILAPGREIDDYGADVKALVKPGFDMLWNAAGYPNSPE